ncbi:unnamed protein product [Clavelina lepadiformis]|uniref:Uncharacterized protein n=1 Tax=Clavelina lepadiformis TaxID=159417 RepID=A0ABP0GTW9_CLALP
MSSHGNQSSAGQSHNVIILVSGSTGNSRETPYALTRKKAVCRFLCAGLFIIPGICLLTIGAIQLDENNVDSITFVVFGAALIIVALISLIQSCIEFRNQHLTQDVDRATVRRTRSNGNRNGDHRSRQVNVAYINYPLPEMADGSALPSYESVTKESAPPSYEEATHDTDEPS